MADLRYIPAEDGDPAILAMTSAGSSYTLSTSEIGFMVGRTQITTLPLDMNNSLAASNLLALFENESLRGTAERLVTSGAFLPILEGMREGHNMLPAVQVIQDQVDFLSRTGGVSTSNQDLYGSILAAYLKDGRIDSTEQAFLDSARAAISGFATSGGNIDASEQIQIQTQLAAERERLSNAR